MPRRVLEGQVGFTTVISKEHLDTFNNLYDELFEKGSKKRQEFRTRLVELAIDFAKKYPERFKEYMQGKKITDIIK